MRTRQWRRPYARLSAARAPRQWEASTPYILITTVRRRLDAALLHTEWAALPMGIGLGVVSPFDVYEALGLDGWARWLYLAPPVAATFWIIVGIWRPMHRRYGLKRSSAWLYEKEK